MLDIAIFQSRQELAKVLVEHGPDFNRAIEYFGEHINYCLP